MPSWFMDRVDDEQAILIYDFRHLHSPALAPGASVRQVQVLMIYDFALSKNVYLIKQSTMQP